MENKENKKKSLEKNIMYSDTDPDGSYTGTPNKIDEDDTPVQDADDL